MTPLSPDQIETYLRDGVLVVDGLLSADEIAAAHDDLAKTLQGHGVHVDNLLESGHHLQRLSSTSGSGGVLDVFYDEWKMKIALHPQLFAWTQQLWKAAYCQNGETLNELPPEEQHKWHPYGALNHDGGYAYIDRICYRLPTNWSDEIARRSIDPTSSLSRKKLKKLSLQRSLTPHLDCCPETFDDPTKHSKWRPIQCFVSLTDNLQANSGGLEVAPGFHKEFRSWAASRPPTVVRNGGRQVQSLSAPCLGEYTHMRPTEDANVMKRVAHVPGVTAGSAVFWDNRLPHANAYVHNGDSPRVVVYCSFLPAAVPLNQVYAQRQLIRWLKGLDPRDQWTQAAAAHGEENEVSEEVDSTEESEELRKRLEQLPELSRKLLALQEW